MIGTHRRRIGLGVLQGIDVKRSGACRKIVLRGLHHQGIVGQSLSQDQTGNLNGADLLPGLGIQDDDVHALVGNVLGFPVDHVRFELNRHVLSIRAGDNDFGSRKISIAFLQGFLMQILETSFHWLLDGRDPPD